MDRRHSKSAASLPRNHEAWHSLTRRETEAKLLGPRNSVPARVRVVDEARVERAYEKHAWILPFAFGVYGVVYAAAFLIYPAPPVLDEEAAVNLTGMTWEEIVTGSPGFARYIGYLARGYALELLVVRALGVALAAFPYRKGERWSWYVSWIFPIEFAGATATEISAGASSGTVAFELAVVVVYLLGLLLPYRKFFPRTQVTRS